MRTIEPPRLRNSRCEIPIETEGRLALPPELVRVLGLEPGDIMALEPFEALGKYVKIRFYRQILTFPLDALSLSIRWSFIVEMLRPPLTALDEEGAIWIPPDVLRLRPGDRPVLSITVIFGSSWPSVDLSEPRSAEDRRQ